MSHFSTSGKPDGAVLNRKILIVDDEESNVQLLEFILQREGYRSIRSTTNPGEAVQMYEEFYPDLVLLDSVMPGMDGIEILESLQKVKKKNYPSILVISANEIDEVKVRSLASGLMDYLAKPIKIAKVLERVKKMLSEEPIPQPHES